MSTWRTLITRTQPPVSPFQVVSGALGAGIIIAGLGLLATLTGQPLLAAAFGSSAALIFLVPDSPLARPINVLGGHLSATVIGLAVRFLLPHAWWAIAIAITLSIATMGLLRIAHPPACGTPIVVITAGAGWSYLLLPVLVGAVVLAAAGAAYRAFLARRRTA
ncbi:HPP family protein [Brevibacterium sp. 91QC2O2]|uniref:HPP family protein n=1 Tax=Brevibacterium TaxID=1696 RepID=UPI00211C7980|nr:HPP family protein [Brevibacterium sp. 91QC2O2]MCQ9385423.1 HPP family protein [Brevibacterium sp. 68QC2CO]